MERPKYTFEEVFGVVAPALPGLDVIIVGGQAVGYWVDQYESDPDVAVYRNIGSKDIDFFGERGLEVTIAKRLNTRSKTADFEDVTTMSGLVTVPLSNGEMLHVDILDHVAGVNGEELSKTAIDTELVPGANVFVMHPVVTMISRAHNVASISHKYDNDHGRKQLVASIQCTRAFLRQIVDDGRAREALRMIKRIFRFALTSDAIRVWQLRKIDVFDSVEPRRELGEQFVKHGYPQMWRELAMRRRR